MHELAKEVVFVSRGQRRMRIRRTHHAELVRVRAELLFQFEPVLQRLSRIFVLKHVWRLEELQARIATIPGLKICKLIGRRQEGMRLAVPFDLRDFEQRLPPSTSPQKRV